MRSVLTKTTFHPPTDYYCEELDPIDEQLCALIAKRKDVSGNNPGFPGVDHIETWCQRYGLNEDMVRLVFIALFRDHFFHAPPVPTGFLRFIPIIKSVEVDGAVYAITYMKQYQNASVVYSEITMETDDEDLAISYPQVDLSISPAYTCVQYSGSGQGKTIQNSFIVTPPLPDHIPRCEFTLNITPRPVPSWRTVEIKAAAVTIK
ncbi:MAG TPA: hypothetical protein VMW83_13035 [Spirochaetia bacterium]|nr:hypothetical protein [Spirochaetia bacterium]